MDKICQDKRTDLDVVGTLLWIPKRLWQHLLRGYTVVRRRQSHHCSGLATLPSVVAVH